VVKARGQASAKKRKRWQGGSTGSRAWAAPRECGEGDVASDRRACRPGSNRSRQCLRQIR